MPDPARTDCPLLLPIPHPLLHSPSNPSLIGQDRLGGTSGSESGEVAMVAGEAGRALDALNPKPCLKAGHGAPSKAVSFQPPPWARREPAKVPVGVVGVVTPPVLNPPPAVHQGQTARYSVKRGGTQEDTIQVARV